MAINGSTVLNTPVVWFTQATNKLPPLKLMSKPTIEQAKDKTHLANALVSTGMEHTLETANVKIEFYQRWINNRIQDNISIEFLENVVTSAFTHKEYTAAFLPERINVDPITRKISLKTP